MEFQKPVIEIIQARKSCRSYDKKEIEKLDLKKLSDYIDGINAGMKTKARFLLSNKVAKSDGSEEKLGTYGFISGAQSFIVGIADKKGVDALQFGYDFESIVLFATDLGLGTCWLGGTFNRNDFKQVSGLSDNEFIPAVSPVGYKKEKPRVFETVFRSVIGANTRKPWDQLYFNENASTPLTPEMAGEYGPVLEMTRLAPSASNKQPWRIIKNERGYDVFICRTKGYGVPDFDLQKNDIGIAMCHFEMTAREAGLSGVWIDDGNAAPDDWEYVRTWGCHDR